MLTAKLKTLSVKRNTKPVMNMVGEMRKDHKRNKNAVARVAARVAAVVRVAAMNKTIERSRPPKIK